MADTVKWPSKSAPITIQHEEDSSSSSNPLYCDLELPLGESYSTFSTLEKAVCSHGLFMMAPNHWDPLTKSLHRPLRISGAGDGGASVLVRISDHPDADALLVRVYGTLSLSTPQREAILAQVRRMLRLSESEERKVREFQDLHLEAKEKGFGRIFRSPTLFEDMVKAVLFCNCQWPRTLSMAKALCDLQLELNCKKSHSSVNSVDDIITKVASSKPPSFTPGTPAVKESKTKHKKRRVTKILDVKIADNVSETEMDSVEHLNGPTAHYPAQNGSFGAYSGGRVLSSAHMVGNFPSPEEIASLDEKYLAKRCGLGYRAGRILKLAQGVVEGRIQLFELEELCNEGSLSNCGKVVDEKLKEINGFGPFTRANVLMCMGFYNVVPTDSETIRHLKQVRARKTTVKTVGDVVEEIYGEYEPFQFLAYWSELWKFYEGWFGKFSEMPSSDYKLVTASNMRAKRKHIK